MVHIDAYEFGRIVIDGEEYTEDLIIYPDHVDKGWRRKEAHSLYPEDIKEVLENPPETLVVGTGAYGRLRILPETRRALENKGVDVNNQKTRRATRLFNKSVEKDKDVVAALHLSC